jgi:hypothetical protein
VLWGKQDGPNEDRQVTDETTLPVRAEPLNSYRLASLAREVAMNMRNLPEILADYGIEPEDYKQVLTWPFYKSALEAAIIEWNGPLSTNQRIKIQAAAALEDALPSMAARMSHTDETLPAVVETGKLFAKLAGIGEQGQRGDIGEKFSITINLGEDKKLTFEKDITPKEPNPALEHQFIKDLPNEPS